GAWGTSDRWHCQPGSEQQEQDEGRDLPVEVRGGEEERGAEAVQIPGEDREAHEDVHVGGARSKGRPCAVEERQAAVEGDDRSQRGQDEARGREAGQTVAGPRLDRWGEGEHGDRTEQEDE